MISSWDLPRRERRKRSLAVGWSGLPNGRVATVSQYGGVHHNPWRLRMEVCPARSMNAVVSKRDGHGSTEPMRTVNAGRLVLITGLG